MRCGWPESSASAVRRERDTAQLLSAYLKVAGQDVDAAVADVRAMRDEDNKLAEAKYARIAEAPEDPEAGRKLLAALGLEPAEAVETPQHQPMPESRRPSLPPLADRDF